MRDTLSGRPNRSPKPPRREAGHSSELQTLRIQERLMDECAWCRAKFADDAKAMGVFAHHDNTDRTLFDEPVRFVRLGGRWIHFWTLEPGWPGVPDGRNVGFMCCSKACMHALGDALHADPAFVHMKGDSPPEAPAAPPLPAEPGPRRKMSAAKRQVIFEYIMAQCAWCGRLLGDRPFIVVSATLAPRRGRRRGKVAIVGVDDKEVGGVVARPGSPAALKGADIGFKMCSEACEARLREAVRRDGQLSIVN